MFPALPNGTSCNRKPMTLSSHLVSPIKEESKGGSRNVTLEGPNKYIAPSIWEGSEYEDAWFLGRDIRTA